MTTAQGWKRSKNSKRLSSYWGIYHLYHKLYDELFRWQKDGVKLTENVLSGLCKRYSLLLPSGASFHAKQSIEEKVKLLLCASGDPDNDPSLPSYLCFGRQKGKDGDLEKTLSDILKSCNNAIQGYEGFVKFPYVKFFDVPIAPSLDLLWLHKFQEEAWYLLERISF